jgi:filamentous hemagglutinin
VLGNVIDQFGSVSSSPLGKGLYTGAALLTSSIVADELDLDTVTAMGAAQNAATNNYLNHRKPNAARMSEKEQYEAAVAACTDGDRNACTLKNQLATLSAQRDAELAKACDGSNPQLCNSLARQASAMGNRVTGRQGELVYANSPEQGMIRYLNVATIGPMPERSAYSDSFHYQASRSTSEALPALLGGEAYAFGSGWFAGQAAKLPATQLSSSAIVAGMLSGGLTSTGIYLVLNRYESTPAGLSVAFTTGAIGSGLVKQGLNYTAGLANTAIPFTWSNVATQSLGSAYGIGSVGWINQTGLTSSGSSWWTSPVFGNRQHVASTGERK